MAGPYKLSDQWKTKNGTIVTDKEDSFPLRNAMNQMLDTMTWTYFFTFTTRYELSRKSARQLIERTWSIWKKDCPSVEKAFWVAEPHKQTGYHLHGLIETDGKDSFSTSSGDLKSLLKQNEWGLLVKSYQRAAGFGHNEHATEGWHRNKIERIVNVETAKNYLTKYVTKSCEDWDLLLY